MNPLDLSGQRVLVTQAQDFMGPALCRTLAELGATVVTDTTELSAPGAAEALVERAGALDAVVVNLALPAPATAAEAVSDDEWRQVFDVLVHPMQRLVRAVLPQMQARRAGRIVLMGSAAALKGMARRSSYAAARGAQLAYIQALGVEVAPQGIRVNAVAQNFVDNPTYFPPEVQANPAFQERLKWQVPLGRLVSAEEDTRFVAYLLSGAADCFVGQVFPICGGWVTR